MAVKKFPREGLFPNLTTVSLCGCTMTAAGAVVAGALADGCIWFACGGADTGAYVGVGQYMYRITPIIIKMIIIKMEMPIFFILHNKKLNIFRLG